MYVVHASKRLLWEKFRVIKWDTSFMLTSFSTSKIFYRCTQAVKADFNQITKHVQRLIQCCGQQWAHENLSWTAKFLLFSGTISSDCVVKHAGCSPDDAGSRLAFSYCVIIFSAVRFIEILYALWKFLDVFCSNKSWAFAFVLVHIFLNAINPCLIVL